MPLSASPLSPLALLAALLLLTAACGSSSPDSADDGTDVDGTTTSSAVTVADGPIDLDAVERLGFSLTGSAMDSDDVDCIVERADGDSTLMSVLVGAGTPDFRFTPDAFTALGVAIHACVDKDVLSASLLALGGIDDESSQNEFSACVSDQIADPVDGDLTYVGLSALRVRFPVPTGATESTIEASRSCVSPLGVASQFAATAEQAAAFEIEVDRDCLVDSIDEGFLDLFWPGLVNGEGLPDLTDPIEECSAPYESGLPTELPADFVAWAGDRALAGVDPGSRNAVFDSAPPMTIDPAGEYEAVFTTGDGVIRIRLYADAAPETVNNFVSLAREGFYDGTTFHRVIEGFMAQGGDPTGSGSGGPGYQFDDEASGLTAVDRRGLIAMANSGPNTNGGQFFITLAPADHLNGLHVVFGEVIEGDDVLADIEIRDPSAPLSRGESLISVEIIEG